VPVIGTGVLPPTTHYSFIAGLDATQLMAEELPLVNYMARAKGLSHPRLALVNIDMAAGHASEPIVKKDATQTGFDVVSSTFAPGAVVTFSTQAAQIVATHPDFVLFTATAASLVIQDRAMRAAGYTGPILNHWNGASNQLLDNLKDPELYVYRDFADPSDPMAAQMRANAKPVGDPTGTSFSEGNYYTEGYVLGELASSVLNACGNDCTPPKFRDLLESNASKINTHGLTAGQVGFSPHNHIFVHTVRYYHWDAASNIGVPVKGFPSASVSQFETNAAPQN
jgi:ABC-type branched-subunit amino acid transport system substrate-binding protein